MKTLLKVYFKKGDTVKVLTGKDKGKQGRVLNVNRENRKITVENINLATHHKKQAGGKRDGGTPKIPNPIDISNIMLVCPRCSKPTKIQRVEVKGFRVRKCTKCEEYIDQK